ncbi:hypothetical protein EI94DRAFT_1801568 [Lactarius quietus]|nr:hypothetical protein EI94DRAFT_1801568 [Lactarius quietus]
MVHEEALCKPYLIPLSTIAGPNAPGEDAPPLCGPPSQGRPFEACCWVPRSGPSTARMGNPQVAAIVCLVRWLIRILMQTVERSIRAVRGNGPAVELKVSDSTFFLTLSPPLIPAKHHCWTNAPGEDAPPLWAS